MPLEYKTSKGVSLKLLDHQMDRQYQNYLIIEVCNQKNNQKLVHILKPTE